MSYSAAKRQAKGAILSVPPPSEGIARRGSGLPSIIFDDNDACRGEHHDGLVISLSVGNCLIKRILVDTGSSTNMILLNSVKEMGLNETDITPRRIPLVGFSGEVKYTKGDIVLPVYAGGINLQVKFNVLECE